MKKLILIGIISLNLFGLSPREILEKAEYNMTPDSVVEDAQMIIYKKDRTLKKSMTIKALGADKGFIEFTAPKRDKGTRYLRIENNLWIYFPDANRTLKISGHMLRQGMMGSDISYDDQTDRTSLLELYDIVLLSEDDKVYTLEMTAKEGEEVSYYRRVAEVDKENFVLLNSLMYAPSGKLLKELTILDYKKIGDRYYITHMRMDDKIMEDSYTEIILENIKIDEEIPENTFTLQNLEKR